MILLESFRLAVSSIFSNKLRTLLTLLGLLIGIASVTTVVSLGDATSAQIAGELAGLGANRISIFHERNVEFSPGERLEVRDVERVAERFAAEIETLSPKITRGAQLLEDVEDNLISLEGVGTQFQKLDDIEMVAGRFLNEFEVEDRRNVIVIDSQLAEEIFGTPIDALGGKVFVRTGRASSAFWVIGVYEQEDGMFGMATGQTGYTPYSTMDKLFSLNGEIDSIDIGLAETEDINLVAVAIVSFLERINDVVGEEKYDIFSIDQIRETVDTVLTQLTLFVAAIAAISLLVGGIGVMNIMLVSVTERTREIGIRKALGAQHVHILLQFLIEAVTVSILGGILGVIFGYMFITIASNLIGMPATVSLNAVVLATVFSIAVGVFFGIYPANKAAKMDPIVALRHE